MSSIIIHGIRIDDDPRRGRQAQLWGMARGNVRYWSGDLESWDAWFDLHSFEAMGLWPGLRADREQTIDWYQLEPAGGRPIYLIRSHPDIPASVPYPIDLVMRAHAFSEDGSASPADCRLFGCTADYLIAFALTMPHVREIILNGVGHSMDAGHQYVHRTLLYWIGIARGRGVTVTIDQPAPGFDRPLSCYSNNRQLYGYECYGYQELDDILKFFAATVPDDDPDLRALRQLARDWRDRARTQPLEYPNELDHLLNVLQRRSRIAAG